jgi:poly-gamma-glutamate synthesis protein (capsule biosynthesis protein)
MLQHGNPMSAPSFFVPGFESQPTGASLVFGGDFCPIRGYEKKMLAGEEIFSPELKSILQKNFSIINLEAPLCEASLPTPSPSGSGLRGSPAIAAYLKTLGVGAWGLANNHIRDFGDEGVVQTIKNLADQGIASFGAGCNHQEAAKPLEARVGDLRVGFLAIAEKELNLARPNRPGAARFGPERNVVEIQKMKEDYDFLVVYVHAGHEFTTVPSPRTRAAYRSFVDAGADAVIGHHPHVVQGIEKYHNGLIAYSLGNLVFDSDYVSAYKTTEIGFLLKLEIGKHRVLQAEVVPYRLEPDFFVAPLAGEDFQNFQNRFASLSQMICEEDQYQREWETNVRFRWETEYRRILTDFSKHFSERKNPDFPRRARNLFTCPTHVEMLEKIFYMLEDPKGGLEFP